MKKIYYMMLMAMMSVAMVSCDGWDSPYYVEDIVGSWESFYGSDGYLEGDILGYDVVRYDFYANHTGRYTYHSYYAYYGLSYVDFDWDTYGNRLKIRYYDGDYEYLYYGFDRAGYLILSPDSHFYRYTLYRPSGMYWKQFTDQAESNGLTVKKEMKVDMSKTSFKTMKVE